MPATAARISLEIEFSRLCASSAICPCRAQGSHLLWPSQSACSFSAASFVFIPKPAPEALSSSRTASSPVVAPQHGVLSLNANGQFTYMPAANYCGKDSFTYSVTNGSLTDTAIMHLDIACVNDLPATVGSISNVSINAGAALNVITATAFSDVDGDALVYSVTSTPALPASLSINASSGVISGTPMAADAGVYTVIVRATEPAPLTGFVTQTFTLTINADSAALFGNGFE